MKITIQSLFYKFWKNIAQIFSKKNIMWHAIAIVLTYILIITGFDWWYFQLFNGTIIQKILFTAAPIGGLLPILLPVILFIVGVTKKNQRTKILAFTLGQAAILGSLISSVYKTFTGRAYPNLTASGAEADITHIFQFGFYRGGIFWGWPSSHTMIAFAMVIALWMLFPKKRWVKILSLIYAFYIGIGVSMSIHWFSDFVAGAIIGTVIGITVGKSFHKNMDTGYPYIGK